MSDKAFYGWQDLKDSEEAIDFVADLVVRGHTITEINRALNEYFPGIDYITVGKIRVKALKKVYKIVKGTVDKGLFVAESIYRLKRLMANPNEKTKNVLAADSQLTHLLGLADITIDKDPEEFAAKIRAFLHAVNDRMEPDPKNKKEHEAWVERQALQEKENPNVSPETKPTNGEDSSKEDEQASQTISKDEEQALNIARAKRLKQDIKDLEG